MLSTLLLTIAGFINIPWIEVGGKNKNTSQEKHLDKYLIAADDFEIGNGNKVSLWLFGF